MDKESGITEITVYVSRVPALGYKVLRVISVPIDGGFGAVGIDGLSSQSGTQITLRGLFFSLTVDKASGCITSIRGISGYEFLAPGACGNQLEFFKDLPKQYDAWNIDPGTLNAAPSTVAEVDTVVLLGRDSQHPAIRITRSWQGSKFVQTISLPSIDADYIDIDNEIDWHETHVLLKAAFPLAASGPFATYEIPYGTIDRPTTRNNSWEKAQFEVPAMRWADLSGPGTDGKVHGLSILNQTKYGYDASGNVLRLTLLRSPKWPDAEADMGHHHFHYALYPHAGTWKDALTVRRGY
jgi:alpha-mannosidase